MWLYGNLVGGFNPSDQYARQIKNLLAKVRGKKLKNVWK